MLTDFVRDHALTIAWFGLMAFVWFGIAQEDPFRGTRWILAVASGVGLVIAGGFVPVVVRTWGQGGAMDETANVALFSVVFWLEVLVCAAGAIVLWRRGAPRWIAWWIALIVAVHFIPLAVSLNDPSLAALGLIQVVGLVLLLPRLRASEVPTSRRAAPLMGITLLAFAAISILVFLFRYGVPW